MEKETSLEKVFESMSDLFADVFGVSGELGDKDESPITSYINNHLLGPNYKMKDVGNGYDIVMDCDCKHDRVYVDVDLDKHEVSLKVRANYNDKAFTNSTYRGVFTLSAPEDCDLEAGWEKTFDEENNKLTISFKKYKSGDNKEASEKVPEEGCCAGKKYNDLLNKYSNVVKANKNLYSEIAKLRSEINHCKLEKEEYSKKYEEVSKKLSEIKSLFN